MKLPGGIAGERVILKPGEYYVSDEPAVLSTLLGSCVSACLYDSVRGIMGMNHFLLAHHRYARDMSLSITEAGRYGIQAMELLVNAMLKRGAQRHYLRAKAFGGGMVLPDSGGDNFSCVGSVNTRFIREFLRNDGIPLVTEDLGGEQGRVIHFVHGDDYPVYVRKIRKIQCQKIAHQEREYWRMSIAEHEQPAQEADIWL